MSATFTPRAPMPTHRPEPKAKPRRALITVRVAAHNVFRFKWLAPLSLAVALLTVLIATPAITRTYDDASGAKRFFFLATLVCILCAGAWLPASSSLRPLMAAGLTRRKILFYQFWTSILYALAAAMVMLLAAIALSVMTGDFSGRLHLNGQATASLWALPALVAVMAFAFGLMAFPFVARDYRFRWYGTLTNRLDDVLGLVPIALIVVNIEGSGPWAFTLFERNFDSPILSFLMPGTLMLADNIVASAAFFTVMSGLMFLTTFAIHNLRTVSPRRSRARVIRALFS